MKKLVIALMAFALVITLAGCGGGGGGGGKSSYTVPKADYESLEKDSNLKPVATAYKAIDAVFTDDTASATAKADALGDYLSETYVGTDTSANDVSTKAAVVKRLRSVISNNNFTGLTIIPCQIQNGVTATTVSEKTVFHVDTFTRDGKTYKNLNYEFDKIQWVNEGTAEAPDWKIVGGFDELGKTFDELSKGK